MRAVIYNDDGEVIIDWQFDTADAVMNGFDPNIIEAIIKEIKEREESNVQKT